MHPVTRTVRLACIAWLAAGTTAGAQALKAPEVEIKGQQVAPGLTVLIGGGGNVGVSNGADGVFIIDDNLEPLTPQLLEAVARISSDPIRFVINTHWHFDHVGGNEGLAGNGAIIVAHDNVRARMSTRQFITAFAREVPPAPAQALPVVTFAESLTLHLNGDDVQVFHVADAHTDGDAIVRFRNANVVHMGDTFFNERYPFIDTSSGGSIDGMIAAVERVLGAVDDDTVIIPGHGPVTDRSGLAVYRDLLAAVRNRVAQQLRAGRSREDAIAAQLLTDYDASWGQGSIKADQLVAIVFDDLSRTMGPQ